MKIYIDIETLPAVHYSMQQIHAMARDKVPANYKDQDKINAWILENKMEIYLKTGLDPRTGWIACVGVAVEDEAPVIFYGPDASLMSDIEKMLKAEKTMLTNLEEYLAGKQYKTSPKFIGWNNASFDMPWLWRASLRARLSKLPRWIVPYGASKYKLPWIYLMEVFGCFQYGKSSKQKHAAEYLGISEPSPDLDGSQVYDQWRNNDLSYGEHCFSDIVTLREIHRVLEPK